MKQIKLFLGLTFLLVTTSCTKQVEKQVVVNYQQQLLIATIYQQHSAEMKALSYQAYNLAEFQLNEALKKTNNPNKLAVVLDLDETVLDNSPHTGQSIIGKFSYPTGWNEWCELAEAQALPGAVDFLNKAVAAGVQVFYISNRDDKLREATKKNFDILGIPLQSDEHLMLKTTTSGKEERRLKVSDNYEIFLLIGDNLSDFSQLYDKQSFERRAQVTDSLKLAFGSRYIVLPNAMYGDWLSALYSYDFSKSEAQKSEIYNGLVKGFNFVKNE